ncbi:MAG: DNA-directed RNA polymerase subunit alpha C-terminal domain-containing protein [bacterium]
MGIEKDTLRVNLANELYELGLPAVAVAKLLGWSQATIVKDVSGVSRPDRPRRPGQIYATALKRYASLVADAGGRLDKLNSIKLHRRVRKALHEWLEMELVLAEVRGAVGMLERLSWPGYPPERAIEAQLLRRALKVKPEIRLADGAELSETGLVRQFLQEVIDTDLKVPESGSQLSELLIGRVAEAGRNQVRIFWDDSVWELLDRSLKELRSRELLLLEFRFGLNGRSVLTLRELGTKFGICMARVNQIEFEALQQLGRRLRLRGPQLGVPLLQTVQELPWRKLPGEREQEEAAAGQVNPNLFRPVDELELSIRTAKCLHCAGIRLVGQLVQKTEQELLKLKNFGRLSLKEIRYVLAQMGLTTEMKLDEAVRQEIARRVDEERRQGSLDR